MSPAFQGALWALGSTVAFTPIFAAAKLSDGLVAAVVLVGFRYLGGAATVLAIILATRTPAATLRSSDPKQHALRAFFGGSGAAGAITAASVLPVGDAAALGLSKGLLVVILAALLLGERISRRQGVGTVLAAAGALVVIQATAAPSGDGGWPLLGVAAALGGALAIALEILMIKVLARRENALGVLAHVNAIGATAIGVPVLLTADLSGLPPHVWAVLLGIGPLAIAGQFCTMAALRRIDASLVAAIDYSWAPCAALFGLVVFGEVPGWAALLGASLVVLGGVLATRAAAPSTRAR